MQKPILITIPVGHTLNVTDRPLTVWAMNLTSRFHPGQWAVEFLPGHDSYAWLSYEEVEVLRVR